MSFSQDSAPFRELRLLLFTKKDMTGVPGRWASSPALTLGPTPPLGFCVPAPQGAAECGLVALGLGREREAGGGRAGRHSGSSCSTKVSAAHTACLSTLSAEGTSAAHGGRWPQPSGRALHGLEALSSKTLP